MKKKGRTNKDILKLIIALGLIIILISGLSYAVFTFSGTGQKELVINAGTLTITYTETNNILLNDDFPISDTEGINRTKEGSNTSFTIEGQPGVYYAIAITNITEGTTLTSEYVKIYLTKGNNPATGFTDGVGKTIESFHDNTIVGEIGNYAVLVDTFSGTDTTHTYNMKAWISKDYPMHMTDNTNNNNHTITTISEEYKFKIQVLAMDTAITITSE